MINTVYKITFVCVDQTCISSLSPHKKTLWGRYNDYTHFKAEEDEA